MDHERFDDLVRTVVSRRSRRRLAATAGALIGGLLANPLFDGAFDALAKKRKGKGKKKKKKNKKKKSCDDLLVPLCPSCQTAKCVGGSYQCEWLPFPDCYGCQEPLCKNGVFECVETGVGTPCGEHCLDPQTQCCANNFQVGEPCDGEACCDPTPPYNQSCCTVNFPTLGQRYCWARIDECSRCEHLCGASLCCKTSEECCPPNGAHADYQCVPIDPAGSGSNCPR